MRAPNHIVKDSAMIDEANISEINSRLEKVTPQPWRCALVINTSENKEPSWRVYAKDDESYEATICELWSGEHDNKACADFIAHAPTDMTLLLAERANTKHMIEAISAAFEMKTTRDGVTTSTHALHNLEAAIMDIEWENRADPVSIRTLYRVAKQLAAIKAALVLGAVPIGEQCNGAR